MEVQSTTLESAMPPWKKMDKPFPWSKFNLVVIGDRYLTCGRRQHVVEGSVPEGTVLCNADIFGEDEPMWQAQLENQQLC